MNDLSTIATVEFDVRPFDQRDIDDLVEELRKEYGDEPTDDDILQELVKWALMDVVRSMTTVTYKGEKHRVSTR